MQHIAIFGASGAIGRAFCDCLAIAYPNATIHAIARKPPAFSHPHIVPHQLDFDDELAIAALIKAISSTQALDSVIVTIGLLHDSKPDAQPIAPEKSLRDITADQLHQYFHVNALLPMMIAKYALPALNKSSPSIFAVLSARVGSISDNRLGGWYGYRMAKASLHMGIKNLSIELQRKNPNAIIVALHPGTVDSELSKPFQKMWQKVNYLAQRSQHKVYLRFCISSPPKIRAKFGLGTAKKSCLKSALKLYLSLVLEL